MFRRNGNLSSEAGSVKSSVSARETTHVRWNSEALLEELGVAVRHVAMGFWDLPDNTRAIEKLARVQVRDPIERSEPVEGFFVYRTFSPEARCRHADPETVVAALWPIDDSLEGCCARCIDEEIERRRTLSTSRESGQDPPR